MSNPFREPLTVDLPIRLLSAEAQAPAYEHAGDAGLDLRSTIDILLHPFERGLIPTGIALEIPEGFAGFVQPRSGAAIKQGLSLVNSPGLIDSNYRGEISVPAINFDPYENIEIHKGDRIAQLVILPVARAQIRTVDMLAESERGTGGFGSTGME